MKHLKLYESFESFEGMSGAFYRLFNILVYIDSIDTYGGEYRVSMRKANGQESGYVGSKNDILKEFTETTDSFELKRLKKETPKKINTKSSMYKDVTYDIVYYVGDKKVETLKMNLERKLAYALKGTFAKNPIYRIGEVKVEENK